VKTGDLIKFRRPVFGSDYGLIRYVRVAKTNDVLGDTGQIGIYCNTAPAATIPWSRRHEYIEVISESR
jgi:hypothetical protein